MTIQNKKKIGFYMTHAFHHAMLKPIYALLKDELPCLVTSDYKEMVAFNPQIIVLAEHHENFFRQLLPETIIIWTRHGFSNKKALKSALAWCDFACVSSEWVRDSLIAKGWFPRLGYWVTGFTAMDQVLQAGTTRPTAIAHLTLGPTLLYAPTFNQHISAIEVLGIDWVKELRNIFPKLNIVIKLHPHTAKFTPHIAKMHQKLAQQDDQVYFIDVNANIYDYLPWTNILLTDASSVMFYYLAFNRPLILVNNPNRARSNYSFAPTGPEWTWRDMGIEINEVAHLPAAVATSLNYPEEKESYRLLYRQRVFGDLVTGQAATHRR